MEQRYVFYFGIPLAVLIVLGEQVGATRKVLLLVRTNSPICAEDIERRCARASLTEQKGGRFWLPT